MERKMNIEIKLSTLINGYDMDGAVEDNLLEDNEDLVPRDINYKVLSVSDDGQTLIIEASFVATS